MSEPIAAPMRAFKLCRLRVVGDRAVFAPLHDRRGALGWYSATSWATCDEGHGHRVPDRACTCGFHGVSGVDELWRLGWVSLETAMLEVDLSGRIIEHRHGYRAERQDVALVHLPPRCSRCGAVAVAMTQVGRGRGALLRPACRRHCRTPVDLDMLADALDTEVRFADLDGEALPRRARATLVAARVGPLLAAGVVGGASWWATGTPTPALLVGPGVLVWLAAGPAVSSTMLRRRTDSALERTRVAQRLHRWAIAAAAVVWAAVPSVASVAMLTG